MATLKIEQSILEASFFDFVNLDKLKRDGKIRRVRSSYYENSDYTIILIFENNNWVIEKIISDNIKLKALLESLNLIELLT